jgi:hypothetical protein
MWSDNTQIGVLEIFAEGARLANQLGFFYDTLANRAQKKRQSRTDWRHTPCGRAREKAYRATSPAFRAARKRRAAQYRAAHRAEHAAYMRRWRAGKAA